VVRSREEQFDEPSVNLGTGDPAQFLGGLLVGVGPPVGVRGCEHVVDLGDGDDSRHRRDALRAQPVWITGPVDALVICPDHRCDFSEPGHGAEELGAGEWVRADGGEVEGVGLGALEMRPSAEG
jgi:hypothetical protein